MEHQIYSLLKTVFLAVEDFQAMIGAQCATRGSACATPRRPEQSADAPQGVPRSGCSTTTTCIMGMLRYTAGPDGEFDADQDGALGVFKDPTLLPVVFPGLMERSGSHLKSPGRRRRIVDIDYCTNVAPSTISSRWTTSSSASGRRTAGCSATLVLGRLAKGASRPGRRTIPLLKREARVAAREQRRAAATRTRIARRARSSTTSRSASCSTPTRRR